MCIMGCVGSAPEDKGRSSRTERPTDGVSVGPRTDQPRIRVRVPMGEPRWRLTVEGGGVLWP